MPLRNDDPLPEENWSAKGSSALMILVCTEIGQEGEEIEIPEEDDLVESWTPCFRQ